MNKLVAGFFFGFFLLVSQLNAQSYLHWVRQLGGKDGQLGYSIATDKHGFIYSTGTFQNELILDNSTDSHFVSKGYSDMYIVKLDADGNTIWLKELGSESFELATDMIVDAEGNLLLSGYFNNVLDFDPGPGNFYLTPTGRIDIFILKLDSSGNFIWARQIGGDSASMHTNDGPTLATDAGGNIYIADDFYGSLELGNTKFHFQAQDGFLVKFDPLGKVLWANEIGGSGNDFIYGVGVDTEGAVYTTGSFSENLELDSAGALINKVSLGQGDAFVLKHNSSGEFVWLKHFGGKTHDYGISMAINNSGNIYCLGHISGKVEFSTNSGENIFTSRDESLGMYFGELSREGDWKWVKRLEGQGYNSPYNKILVNEKGIYIGGTFSHSIDLDAGMGQFRLSAEGDYDGFVARFDFSGNVEEGWRWGSDISTGIHGMALDEKSNLYLTGSFSSTMDFDPGSGKHVLTATPWVDAFILKMVPCCSNESWPGKSIPVVTFPNPTKGAFCIDLGECFSEVHISIYNAAGQLLLNDYREKVEKFESECPWAAGIYYIRLQTKGGYSTTIRLVKE